MRWDRAMPSGGPAARGRIAVVGAGVSGLAAARRLHELAAAAGFALDVRVFEASLRAGGLVRTEHEGDLLLEAGPDQFLTAKPAALELCRRLALETEIVRLTPDRPSTRIVHRGRLARLPDGPTPFVPVGLRALWAFRLLSPLGRARLLCEPLVPRRAAGAPDESLAVFVRRRFGRELCERVVEPLVAGIYLGRADRLSAAMTLPRLVALERERGSVVRALREHRAPETAPSRAFPQQDLDEPTRGETCTQGEGRAGRMTFASLRGGMERLIDRLVADLPPGTLRLGTAVASLGREAGGWRLCLAAGAAWHADGVVLACPPRSADRLLQDEAPAAARLLDPLPHASSATIHLLYGRQALARPLDGFGFFSAPAEGLPVVACNYTSEKLEGRAPAGSILLRAFVGGARFPDLVERDDAELVRIARGALEPLLGLTRPPRFSRVQRNDDALPQYPVGYPERLTALRAELERLPGLALCGSAAGAFGISDCVREAEQAAETCWHELARGDIPAVSAARA